VTLASREYTYIYLAIMIDNTRFSFSFLVSHIRVEYIFSDLMFRLFFFLI